MNSNRPVTILYMEDDSGLARLFQKRMRRSGYDVDLAADGEQGLAMYESGIYDIVILDQKMPRRSGIDVIRSLADKGRLPPTIMLTGAGNETVAVEAMKLGASDYIIKDSDTRYLELLPSVIESVLRNHRLVEEKQQAEEALQKAYDELERRVEERTAELVTANEKLLLEISERKRMEEALRESEERMRRVIESAPIGIQIIQGGAYTYVNPAFVAMFGYDGPDQVVGMPADALYAHNDSSREQTLAKVGESGLTTTTSFDLKGNRKNGDPIEVSIWKAPIEFHEKPATLGFVIDVTEENALKLKLLQAQKMEAIGTLAGGIAHDFNNILSVIMGYLDMALLDVEAQTQLEAYLQRIQNAGDRATDLVKQILTLSRQSEQDRKPIFIAPIVKETVKFLRASIPATVEIRQKIDGDLGPVLAVSTQIHQVLMNLCTNASHAMRETGGVLEIRIEGIVLGSSFTSQHPNITPGPHVRLTIRDTGHGMSPGVVERIFEPYFTTKKHGEGTGLGLAVVHGIVASHGGAVTLNSRQGEGTTFRVYLPVVQEKVSSQATLPQPMPAGNERILFVDDEPDMAQMTDQMLSRLGYEVITKTSSNEAMELFRSEPGRFDLVITDMTMPHMTGAELAEEFMKIRPEIPIILCTGFSELITEDQAKSMGVRKFLIKPIRQRELARIIRRVLDGEIEMEK
ncbi:response regulator [Thermodesulfobacteriota bacterium]